MLSVRLRTKNERSTGLRGVGRNDLRPFRPKNLLVFGTPTECISERVRGLQPSASVIPRTLSEMHSVGVPHSQIFRPKGPKIVASYAPEPCRSFVFGPKPYAQHPFDFELAPSTTISGAVWRPPHKREAATKSDSRPVCGYCLWLLFVATVCGYCLWLLFVAPRNVPHL